MKKRLAKFLMVVLVLSFAGILPALASDWDKDETKSKGIEENIGSTDIRNDIPREEKNSDSDMNSESETSARETENNPSLTFDRDASRSKDLKEFAESLGIDTNEESS
mgnify:FL=1